MAVEVELSTLDLRYEGYRMRDKAQEVRLMTSIAERGIEEPLEGVVLDGTNVVLNGFKRYRCARKLGIHSVPYASLGEDETMGIIGLLKVSNNRSLSILEQAGFIDDPENRAPDDLGRDRHRTLQEQGLGEHAAGPHRGNEREDTPHTVQRCIPQLLVDVYHAAVHAHELGDQD